MRCTKSLGVILEPYMPFFQYAETFCETLLFLSCTGKPSRHNQKKRASDESVRANLQQYGLSQYYIDILVADSSKQSLWRTSQLFDAIITDREFDCVSSYYILVPSRSH